MSHQNVTKASSAPSVGSPWDKTHTHTCVRACMLARMFTVRLSFCVILLTVAVFVSWQGILSTAVQPPTSVRSPNGDASRARRVAS